MGKIEDQAYVRLQQHLNSTTLLDIFAFTLLL